MDTKVEVYKFRPYRPRARIFDVEAGQLIAVLNDEEAHENDIYAADRVIVVNQRTGKEITAVVELSSKLVKRGEVGLFTEANRMIGVNNGDQLELRHTEIPAGIEYIKRKMDGKEMQRNEVSTIIGELMDNKLAESELASWMAAMYIRDLTSDETVYLTESIIGSGGTLDLKVRPIVDKHCSGGVAGNRTTMVIVPILAAAGVYAPKTSSRSITSAAGTADTMEVLAPVDIPLEEVRRVVTKIGGCIVWGGGVALAPADDRLIRLRHTLRLDPKGVLLASILAKKKAVGAEYVAIDIPIGRGAKIADEAAANALARDFIEIGGRLGMKMQVLITDGSDPIGHGIGPALECVDVLNALSGKEPLELVDKSSQIAGLLLEMAGKVEKGRGYSVALDIVKSGKALKKMREIIAEQGGNPKVTPDEIPVGRYRHLVTAAREGRIQHVDNRMVNNVARAAGAPKDKGAGLILHAEKGDKVKPGDKLFEIVAESEAKLDFAIKTLGTWEVVELQRVILGALTADQIR